MNAGIPGRQWAVFGIHVIPLDDLRPHNESPDCWCSPTADDGVVIHNSADLREQYEQGRKMA